jgi:hypothetical protein
VDISVLVQDALTNEPVSDIQVTITAARRGSPAVITNPATTDAATNKLYHAAIFDLPEPGEYTLEVSVAGVRGDSHVELEVDAAAPLPPWLTMWPWLGWPVLAIAWFATHQLLARRRKGAKHWTRPSSQQLQPR